MSSENPEKTKKKVSFPIKVLLICVVLFIAGWGVSQYLNTSPDPVPDQSAVTKMIKPVKPPVKDTGKPPEKNNSAAQKPAEKPDSKQADTKKPETDKISPKGTTPVPDPKASASSENSSVKETQTQQKPGEKEPADSDANKPATQEKKVASDTKADSPEKKDSKKLNFPKKPGKPAEDKSVKQSVPAPESMQSDSMEFFFAVQVGAFKSDTNANKFAEKLRNEGYPEAYVAQFEDRNRIRWNVVRLGKFKQKSDAFALADDYKENHKEKAFVTYADAMMMITK